MRRKKKTTKKKKGVCTDSNAHYQAKTQLMSQPIFFIRALFNDHCCRLETLCFAIVHVSLVIIRSHTISAQLSRETQSERAPLEHCSEL